MRSIRPVACLVLLLGLGASSLASSSSYQVRLGDTLTGIAGRFHVRIPDLVSANHLRDPNHIEAGTTLQLPAAAPANAKAGLPSKLLASPSRLALRPLFPRWAATYGVPADLLQAMTWYESGWQNSKVSSTGARGIGQLMPSTVAFVNGLLGTHLDPKRPEDNIRMSARYLAFLLHQTGGRPDQALGGYYQGLASLRARGPYSDTKAYVAGILSWRSHFAS